MQWKVLIQYKIETKKNLGNAGFEAEKKWNLDPKDSIAMYKRLSKNNPKWPSKFKIVNEKANGR